ncbi:MAG: PAS domain-containing sensor histidine kinase [Candidatus Saganbacteria bacterium]|nr:PAS domain-containing sensor histidine kinase [Candidatus Saganbacteria bacterium]
MPNTSKTELQQLKQELDKYQTLVQECNSIILTMDMDGKITFINNFGLMFFGYTNEELLGKNVIGTIVPETDEAGENLKAVIQEILLNPEKHVINLNENMRKNGERVWTSWTNKRTNYFQNDYPEVLCIGNDVTERIKLRKLREELTHMIVHDFKNLLIGVVTPTELLLSSKTSPVSEEQIKFLEIIKTSYKKILNLIMTLLETRKIETDKMPIQKNTFQAKELEASLEWFRLIAKQEGQNLTFETEESLSINADKDLITRVLENLLTNAFKHTPTGGKVTLTICNQNNGVLFSVQDSGEGIPSEYLARIFEPFFKVEHQKLKTAIDTGLGLSFCKMAVEAHGSQIHVQSEPQKGSCFYFYLDNN